MVLSSSSSSSTSLPMFGGVQGQGQTKQNQQRCKLKSFSIDRMLRMLFGPCSNKSGIRPQIRLFTLCIFSVSLSFLLVGAATRSFSSHSHLSSSSPLPGKGYTVLINTWKRNDLLKLCVAHYASCASVDSIHVVWSERDPPEDSLRESLKRAIKSKSKNRREVDVVFDMNEEDSLNNRFREINDLKTDAIFSIDDDVITPCSSLEFAYTVWHSAPSSMVGFVPRMHWLHNHDMEGRGVVEYRYAGWWSVWWHGTYSMVLSKAAFFHKKYLSVYTYQMLPSIRDYITKNRNCEDIAMSFLVANVTGSPPIWVQGKIDEIGSSGISSLGGHTERRSKCVNDFAVLYGTMPLVPTTVKAVDSRNTWLW